MKIAPVRSASLSSRIILVALAILLTFGVEAVSAASEPGTVTIVLAVEPPNLDATNSIFSPVGSVILKNVVEPLTEVNPADSSIMPRLATAWKQIDATTWHFSLRKGVKFHDGSDFNADVVLFNIKRLYDKRLQSRTLIKLFSNLKMEGKALDSYTLEIKTDKFEPLMPTLMGNLTICSTNTPSDKLVRNPIGTGPYRFVKWDAGTQIMLDRFDGYWGAQPQVKRAVYVWRSEPAVRAAMVLIGEADLAGNIAPGDANRPDMDHSYFNAETTHLRIGGAWEPPLNDRRVRLALNYAVDRNAIRGSILSKDVVPATQLVPPTTFGYNPDLKVWPYDPPKAKQLLDEARKEGVPVDREILMVGRVGYFPGAEELMEALMTMYKAVGLNVKLRMYDVNVYTPYRQKPFPTNAGPYILENSHDNSLGDAVFTVFYYYHCNGVSSATCDKRLDELIEKAQVAIGEERKTLWQAAFKRIHEETVSSVMLYHMVGYCRVGKRINFKPSIATNSEIQLSEITFK
jgi:peptide/nickel transport system substrate-binding protein